MRRPDRIEIGNGTPMETANAYARLVRIGTHASIGGTAAIGAGGACVGVGDAAAQAEHIMGIIADALDRAGGSLADVTITRVLLTDIDDWHAVAEVRARWFAAAGARPAITIMEVGRFVDPDWLVEIEADAVIG